MSRPASSILIVASLALAAPASASTAPKDPRRPVAAANAAARVQPASDAFQGARQTFAWTDGGLYQVYTAPGRVTDIVLEAGEHLAGAGPIAAGDTVRWVIGDTESGADERRRVHVLVKPTLPGLMTNLVINTDRRTYYLELRATAATYMASVGWAYPKDALLVPARSVAAPPAPAVPPTQTPPATATLNFDYRISGDKAPWRPQQVFDDGSKVRLVFPAGLAQGDLPPLFVIEGGQPVLVNYRIEGRQMVVDRLFDRAELRLGDKRKSRRVRIERTGRLVP